MKRSVQLLLSLSLALLAASSAAAGKLRPGDQPPDYLGHNIDGDDVHVSDFAGRAVVVSYWATWCPYCLKELPILNNIQRVAGKDRLAVVAVNVESRDTFRAARRALADTLDVNFAWDPGKRSQHAYVVTGLPHLVIIGRDGRIVSIHVGYGEGALTAIAEELNTALAATPPAPAASSVTPTP
ncbi:MAG: TlpA family protein disulfide reductase [Paucibacter sp.]|nr:TlpA family protein disulfide reductase [Roseateles sp.]